jgi:hypothetical protein
MINIEIFKHHEITGNNYQKISISFISTIIIYIQIHYYIFNIQD